MRQYIARRLLLMIATLGLVALVIFTLMRLAPGDAALARVMTLGTVDATDEEAIASIRSQLGIDRSFASQLGSYLAGIVHGDLGRSLYTGNPVISELKKRLPVTLELGIIALLVSSIVAISVGVLAALRQDSRLDYIARVTAIGFIAIPNFWVATMVILLPAIWWEYLPPLSYVALFDDPATNLRQMLPPGIILGLASTGGTMRLTRSALLEVLRQDYIRTAYAKGLGARMVVGRHALKNALIPVFTIWGAHFPILVGGSVIIENIFVIPGMGQLMLSSLTTMDYTQVQSLVLIIATAVLVVNFLVDLGYAWLDPRIRYS